MLALPVAPVRNQTRLDSYPTFNVCDVSHCSLDVVLARSSSRYSTPLSLMRTSLSMLDRVCLTTIRQHFKTNNKLGNDPESVY